MGKLFNKSAISDEAQGEKDSLGNGGYLQETNIYDCTIHMTRTWESARGAIMLVLEGETNEKEPFKFRHQTCIQSGAGKTYFTKDGKDYQLPGFALLSSLATFAGTDIEDLEPEERMWPVYDKDENKEVETEVDALPELCDFRVYLAVEKHRVNKQAKNDDGDYVDTNDERFINEVSKAFHYPSKLTVPEANADEDTPEFFDRWLEKNEGRVIDKFKEVKEDKRGSTKKRGPAKRPSRGESSEEESAEDDKPAKKGKKRLF